MVMKDVLERLTGVLDELTQKACPSRGCPQGSPASCRICLSLKHFKDAVLELYPRHDPIPARPSDTTITDLGCGCRIKIFKTAERGWQGSRLFCKKHVDLASQAPSR